MPRLEGIELLARLGLNEWAIETVERLKFGCLRDLNNQHSGRVHNISLSRFVEVDGLIMIEPFGGRMRRVYTVAVVRAVTAVQHIVEGTPPFFKLPADVRSLVDDDRFTHQVHSTYLAVKLESCQREVDQLKGVVAELVEQMKTLKPEFTM